MKWLPDIKSCLGIVVVMGLIVFVLLIQVGAGTPQDSKNCYTRGDFTLELIKRTIGDENFCNFQKGLVSLPKPPQPPRCWVKFYKYRVPVKCNF